MLDYHRRLILVCVSGACMLLMWSANASGQTRPRNVECKRTETQPECHARLKCKAGEDLKKCQKRLLKCKAGEDLDDCKKRVRRAKRRRDRGDSDRARDDRDRRDRDRRDRDDDRSDRDDDDRHRRDRARRDRDDRDRGDRDRGDRDRGDRDRGDRARRGRGDRARRRRGSRGRGRRGRGDGGGGGRGFKANKRFGLGLEIGAPTGLNGKYFLSDSGAIDFGIGWIYRHYYYDEGLHLYLDYLWHPVSLTSSKSLELPLYIGVGGRVWDFEYCERPNFCYNGTAIGIRVPFGISFDFNNAPLDIFIQLVPVLDFLTDDYYDRYNDRAHFGIDVSAGIRFWFF